MGVTFFSKFYNTNLHNIARSDSLEVKTKNLVVISERVWLDNKLSDRGNRVLFVMHLS